MLESIIEHNNLWWIVELQQGLYADGTLLANYPNEIAFGEVAKQLKGLIPNVSCGAGGGDEPKTPCLTSVTTGQNGNTLVHLQ